MTTSIQIYSLVGNLFNNDTLRSKSELSLGPVGHESTKWTHVKEGAASIELLYNLPNIILDNILKLFTHLNYNVDA